MDSLDFLLDLACITLNPDESRYNYYVLRSKVGGKFDLHKQFKDFIIPKFGEILSKHSKYLCQRNCADKAKIYNVHFTINDSIFFAIFMGLKHPV